MNTFWIKLLKFLIELFNSSSKPGPKDGMGPGLVESKLRDKLKKEGWHK